MGKLASRVIWAVLLLAVPAHVSAQQGSGIAGTVRDASGAVLPGVTVEVSSPALIEKTRSATTDGEGKFSIIQLRPGVYSVAFTLPGFSTVKRDNIELTSDFTATVNADMKVGGVEETITVAAESPVVDVQSITQRTVMTREVMDTIPTGRNIQAIGIMIPGTSLSPGGGGALSRDVGGSGSLQQSPLQYRGSGRHGADHRRAAPEQPVRAGRLQRRLLERRQLPGNQLRDRCRLRRDGPGRHAREHGAQGRWQFVQGHRLRQLRRRRLGCE